MPFTVVRQTSSGLLFPPPMAPVPHAVVLNLSPNAQHLTREEIIAKGLLRTQLANALPKDYTAWETRVPAFSSGAKSHAPKASLAHALLMKAPPPQDHVLKANLARALLMEALAPQALAPQAVTCDSLVHQIGTLLDPAGDPPCDLELLHRDVGAASVADFVCGITRQMGNSCRELGGKHLTQSPSASGSLCSTRVESPAPPSSPITMELSPQAPNSSPPWEESLASGSGYENSPIAMELSPQAPDSSPPREESLASGTGYENVDAPRRLWQWGPWSAALEVAFINRSR